MRPLPTTIKAWGGFCRYPFHDETHLAPPRPPDRLYGLVRYERVCGQCPPTRVYRHYQPDAWIKLCGLSNGCTVGPKPPHPWHGNNTYNTTALDQTVPIGLEEAEGVRFWIVFQNDGTQSDTFTVQGCKGTPRFTVNAVLVGFYTDTAWRPKHITDQFKAGTATFTVAPGNHVGITLNIIATTTTKGVSYRCPVTITSKGNPTLKDTVAGIMTTT